MLQNLLKTETKILENFRGKTWNYKTKSRNVRKNSWKIVSKMLQNVAKTEKLLQKSPENCRKTARPIAKTVAKPVQKFLKNCHKKCYKNFVNTTKNWRDTSVKLTWKYKTMSWNLLINSCKIVSKMLQNFAKNYLLTYRFDWRGHVNDDVTRWFWSQHHLSTCQKCHQKKINITIL